MTMEAPTEESLIVDKPASRAGTAMLRSVRATPCQQIVSRRLQDIQGLGLGRDVFCRRVQGSFRQMRVKYS